jgi:hypothetical protein
MGFTKLADRLNIAAGQTGHIPPVLAGPMLRNVTSQSVTVWLALRAACTVTLTVSTSGGVFVMSGSGKTVAIGINLHIIAVTAQSTVVETAMSEGVIYQYDLSFNFDDKTLGTMSLDAATNSAPLSYKPYLLPTFCLPPQDPNALRLICGSCRKASGDGKDNLALLDQLIAQAALSTTPLLRPHQLLLMGDQIYADDVAESLLTMLVDADRTLLGWEENLPNNYTTAQRPPYTRWKLLDDTDFTSEDLRNHLMSLGEFLSMYLFVWSDALWPKPGDPLPTYEEIKANVLAAQSSFDEDEFATITSHLDKAQGQIDAATRNLEELRQSLPQVRKALANIPTYMICDDHDVTDDWNMTLGWWRSLYSFGLGVRIIQNGVLAYALCQHWGNAPQQFDSSVSPEPGAKLLTLLDKGDAKAYDTNSDAIRSRIAVHTSSEIFNRPGDPGFFHDSPSLTYNFTVEGTGHQIIFTDTRTWRSFPHGTTQHADLLTIDQFKEQIENTLSLRTAANVDRVLIVVLTTNAPPTEAIRAFTRHDFLANRAKRSPDVYESWEMLTVPYDRLLKALTDKLPLNNQGQHAGSVILLSGDVHHSFATRLVYDATNRFEDDPQQPKPALAVFAQLVASSLKKQTDDTLEIHKQGYDFDPTHVLTPAHVKEGYVGWNVAAGRPERAVGSGLVYDEASKSILRGEVTVDHDSPTLVFTPEIPEAPNEFQLKETPDFRYRLEYLPQSSKAAATKNFNPVEIPPMSGGSAASRAAAIQKYKTAMDHLVPYHGDGAGGGQIVGMNNLCEVGFQWGAGNDKYVIHKVRWRYGTGTSKQVLEASYRIKLDPKDFPDITPAVTP